MRIALAGLFDPSPAQGEAGLEVEPANKPGLPKLPLKVLGGINDGLGRIVLRDKLAGTGTIGGLGELAVAGGTAKGSVIARKRGQDNLGATAGANHPNALVDTRVDLRGRLRSHVDAGVLVDASLMVDLLDRLAHDDLPSFDWEDGSKQTGH